MSFSKTGQEGKIGPVWDWYQWEGGGYKERVAEGEYHGNTMYSCMKMDN
jgi:hypothetical protein